MMWAFSWSLVYSILILNLINQCGCSVTNSLNASWMQYHAFVQVRPGCHMFYWLFFTTAKVRIYTDRPLVVWLQGGPGSSSTGVGNFLHIGPLDIKFQKRKHTWVKHFNVLFVDSPVGTGFSYVNNITSLPKTNDRIAQDFVVFLRHFYYNHPDFGGIKLYIFGHSYGGKMAVDVALRVREAERARSIRSNLQGIALGNTCIDHVASAQAWAPLLLAAGRVDGEGAARVSEAANATARLCSAGRYEECRRQWAHTHLVVQQATGGVSVYNLMAKQRLDDSSESYHTQQSPGHSAEELEYLMNVVVKREMALPEHVVWGSQRLAVQQALFADTMRVITPKGQLAWVQNMSWYGAQHFLKANRNPIWVNNKLQGYFKGYANFRFYWINGAGHNAPKDNPAAIGAIHRYITSFG